MAFYDLDKEQRALSLEAISSDLHLGPRTAQYEAIAYIVAQ